MGPLKDNNRTSKLSIFIDSKRLRSNPFGENKACDRVYRRAERIAAGVYLVTNHINSEEPIRNILRLGSIRLLESIMHIGDEMRSPESAAVSLVHSTIRNLISYTKLLAVAGFVSIQNSVALSDALDELANLLTSSEGNLAAENVTLSLEELIDVRNVGLKAGEIIKDKTSLKDMMSFKNNKAMSDRALNTPSNDASSTRRREIILDVLKSGTPGGRSIGIRDLSSTLPEYSEKMIQRELAELVQLNIVRKVGEKRWSRYLLV